MDVAPVFIEFLSTLASMAPEKYPDNVFQYLDYGYETGLPGTLCAGQLGGAGALLYGDWPKPDLILSGAPGFCDVNSKILEYTARTLDIPLLHLDMSAYHDERAVAYYRHSFRDVISRLEEFTGNKLDPDRLERDGREHQQGDRSVQRDIGASVGRTFSHSEPLRVPQCRDEVHRRWPAGGDSRI